MALFDSIIGTLGSQYGLSGSQSGGLLSGLLGLIANGSGGFAGFLDLFRNAGHGDAVDSWVQDGDNTPLEPEQVESALGSSLLDKILGGTGLGKAAALPVLASLIPMVVDKLTPNGVIPSQSSILSTLGSYLTGSGASGAASQARAMASSADDDSGSFLKWLIPLLLIGLLIALGFWFCGRGTAPGNVNTNANRTNTNANRPATTNTTNTNVANANANATSEAARTLAEVVLPDGTKLQAYPGGIEDQLIKFLNADYKTATPEQLKEKWFNFDDLNFKFGTTELAPESKRQMDNITAILKAYKDVKIKIGGYTDKKGDDAANLKLSDSRAKAVQAALQKAGVGAQVPEAEGYGEKFATVDENASDDARKVDRKTAVRLIKQ